MRRRLLIAAGAVAVLAALFFLERQIWLIDDRNHADGVLLREEIANAKRQGQTQASVIAVNGGNWLALCLVAAGESPQQTLRAFGKRNRLRVPTVQRIRSWLYAGHVPKDEMALVILTERNSIRTRRLPDAIANANFKTACALRSDDALRWR